MKVIHIINNLDRGGAETLLLNIIKGLHEHYNDIELKVLILEDKQYLRPFFEMNSIDIDVIDCINIKWLSAVFKVFRYLKSENPDVVHTHLLSTDKIGLFAAFLAGVKRRYSTIHDMEKSKGRSEIRARWIASRFAHKLVAVSRSAKDFCIVNKLYPKNKIVVICNVPGFQVENAIALQKKSSFSAVHVGRLHKFKGQKYLIEAIKLLSDKGMVYPLTIYGAGAEYDFLNAYISKHNLLSISLAGQTDNVSERLVEHSAFIASSISEGFNIALVEALSVGLPVVATKLDPHIEILTQFGDYPYLVDPANPGQIADKIEEIASLSSEQYYKLSELSIKLSKKYSFYEMIKSYRALYS